MTERDVQMLEALARFRLLTPIQLVRIVGGSERGVRNRVRILAAHKYLVRLAASIIEPVAYGLANKGARHLSANGHHINARFDWTAENYRRSNHFRVHTLAIADTMLHFDHAAALHALTLVDHQLSHLPEETQQAARPFASRIPVQHNNKPLTIHLEPDRLFALSYPNVRHNFALEVDRGTMDVWANRLIGKSSIRRKLLAYVHGREQRRFVERWGFKSFRVLVVTTSEARIKNMLRAQHRVAPSCPPGFFMYSTPERLAQHGALGPAWITSKRDDVSLLHDGHVTSS